MEMEVLARASLPVAQWIIALLGVSIFGCACVLVYSLGNYGKSKKDAEEVRNYIMYRGIKAAGDGQSGDACTIDAHSVTVEILDPVASITEYKVDEGPRFAVGPKNNNYTTFVVRSVSDTFVGAANQGAFGAAVTDLTHWNATTGNGDSGDNESP